MHEISVTKQLPDGRWVNVNGLTGAILTPRFPFEAPHYTSLQAADLAAQLRSRWEGRLNEQMGPAQQLMAGAMAKLKGR